MNESIKPLPLTPRQVRVLEMLAADKTTIEIAKVMCVSRETIKHECEKIRWHYDTRSILAAAVMWARESKS